MKKIVLLISIVIATAASAGAQVIKDDFETNSNGWTEYSGRKGEAVIKDGKLCLSVNKNNDGYSMSTCYLGIDPSKNFEITANLVNTKINDEERGIGIIFNYMDDYNYDVFQLTKEFAVYRRYVENRLVGYRYAQVKIDKKAKDHTLSIKSTYQRLEFSIDNMMALEIRYAPLHYSGFGIGVFSADGDQSAEIESIEIRQ